jgi:hypothetical protein
VASGFQGTVPHSLPKKKKKRKEKKKREINHGGTVMHIDRRKRKKL